MKFSFAYVKKNPLLFTMIALVFGVFVLLMLNKGASNDATTVTNTGPSDAQIAAQAQLAAQQLAIGGNIQIAGLQIQALAQQGANDMALAQVAANVNLAQIAAQAHSDELGVAASLTALQAQLAANVQINNSNNQFQIDYANIAAENSLHIVQSNNALMATLGAQQLQAFTTQATLGAIGTLNSGKRDNAFAAYLATMSGTATAGSINAIMQPNGTSNGSGGNFFSTIGSGLFGIAGLALNS